MEEKLPVGVRSEVGPLPPFCFRSSAHEVQRTRWRGEQAGNGEVTRPWSDDRAAMQWPGSQPVVTQISDKAIIRSIDMIRAWPDGRTIRPWRKLDGRAGDQAVPK